MESKEPVKMTLKAARVNAGYNQKEAGEAIGVSEAVISNWERGLTYPDVAQLKRIENAYHVTYDNLIFLLKKFQISNSGRKIIGRRRKHEKS